MKVLIVHNYYQKPGGEEQVFLSESELLKKKGHTVIHYTVHNDNVSNINKLSLALNTIWNNSTFIEIKKIIRKEKPDIAHFHNTLPLISPSAYYAAYSENVPVIQTLHNYRILCPNSLFLRDGNICMDCLAKKVPWPSVINGCYRESRSASAVVAGMLTIHRILKTWTNNISVYIALTNFAKEKFIEGGIPSSKIVVKPNFVDVVSEIGEGKGNYALYVGRLSKEKGILTLLEAWKKIDSKVPLKIVGDGPLVDLVIEEQKSGLNIELLGWQPINNVYKIMKDAKFLIFPSVCFETFGRVIIEAFSMGTPVIASNIGAAAELIEHEKTGLHFDPNNPNELVEKINWMLENDDLNAMRNDCRKYYELNYDSERNYEMLMNIYKSLIKK